MHTHTFSGLTINQVEELMKIFGERCHSWDKIHGYAKVDFDSEEEAQHFIQQHEFRED